MKSLLERVETKGKDMLNTHSIKYRHTGRHLTLMLTQHKSLMDMEFGDVWALSYVFECDIINVLDYFKMDSYEEVL